MASEALLSLKNPVFAGYAFYGSIVILKKLSMALLTARQRFPRKVEGLDVQFIACIKDFRFRLSLLPSIVLLCNSLIFANPEDASAFAVKKVILDDPAVERVRRNHLNDVENIPAFLSLGLLYVLIQPSPVLALWHFRVFAVSRILHTIAYQLPLPQPSRFLFFITGYAACVSMAVQILTKIYVSHS